jgi:hypothetical protein
LPFGGTSRGAAMGVAAENTGFDFQRFPKSKTHTRHKNKDHINV